MPLVHEKVHALLPTRRGNFIIHVFQDDEDAQNREHVALVKGTPPFSELPLVRIHSECLTGDLFSSLRCDCQQQLHMALEAIAALPAGVLIYLRQEGRGIGLIDKLRAYNLQDQGLDTVEANIKLGHKSDHRDYAIAIEILRHFSIDALRLLTNNPQKVHALEEVGITVVERLPIISGSLSEHARRYLQVKAERLGHYIDIGKDLL